MEAGTLDARTLVEASLARIARYDDALNAVMSVNPDALARADELDAERRAGTVRGPLHGIPLALKDNINTPAMPTTGGALAFAGHHPPYDADIVGRLQAAGAIIIAKTSLTELANWVADDMPANYSALGGQGVNPYGAMLDAGGSSSGIGTTVGFWAANIGTETSGSLLNPANANQLVSVKPTVGRVSMRGVMPITADQDVAGPMTRTVTDAALVLDAIESDTSPCSPLTGPPTRESLAGVRVGVPRTAFRDELSSLEAAKFADAENALRVRGATVVDVEIPTAEANRAWRVCAGYDDAKGADDDCSVVFKYGMKRDFNAYLDSLGPDAPVATLTELRAFNEAHQQDDAIRYGQAQLDISDEMDVVADRERYLADRAKDRRLAATDGIDAVLASARLDALMFARSDGAPIVARAGYPAVYVPTGFVGVQPFGVMFAGAACSEADLLDIAHAFEQATRARRAPDLPTGN